LLLAEIQRTYAAFPVRFRSLTGAVSWYFLHPLIHPYFHQPMNRYFTAPAAHYPDASIRTDIAGTTLPLSFSPAPATEVRRVLFFNNRCPLCHLNLESHAHYFVF
jgi:hypothetical protein